MSKYNEQLVKAIEKAIESGMSNIKACDLVGIAEPTFYKWLDEKVEFSKRIKAARSNKIKRLLKTIDTAGKKQWQAAAWILERTEFKEYGNKSKHEVTGEDGNPIEHKHKHELTDKDLEAVIRDKD